MARSPEHVSHNAPLPTYDAEVEALFDAKAAAKLAEVAHPGLSEALAKQEAQGVAVAETTALIKEAKAMRAIVARVPLYRDAFGYDSGAQLSDTQRIPLRAAFQVMLRGGSLAQKLKEAQKLMVRGQCDVGLNEEIAREIAHIKKYEAIVAAALKEQQITLPEASTPTVDSVPTRRTLKVMVSEEATSVTPDATILETPVEPEPLVGDKRESAIAEARTIKTSSMSAESLTKTPKVEALSQAEIIRERSKAWSLRVQDYKAKLDSLKQQSTATYIESLPAYQSFEKNLQILEPLLQGGWAEDDAEKTRLLQENMQRLAANFFTIEYTANQRRAAFVASVGAETAAMRDLMDDADGETANASTVEKKTGWFNTPYREAEANTVTEEPGESAESVVTAEPEVVEPIVLTPEIRIDSAVDNAPSKTEAGAPEAVAVEAKGQAEGQLVETGSVADIPRSDGSVSRATVAAVLPDGKLLFSWIEQGQKHSKVLDRDGVTFIEVETAVGDSVSFPRSDGSRSVGTLQEIFPDGKVSVVWSEGHELLSRNVYLGDVLPAAELVSEVAADAPVEPVPHASSGGTAEVLDGYVDPAAMLRAQESWRTVGQEGSSTEVLKLQKLTDTAVALEEQLTNAIVKTGYHDPSQPRHELAEQLVAVRNRLKSVMVRVRALTALPAEELTVDEVHALETQVGEVEYGVKRLIQKETVEPAVKLLGMPVPTATSGPFAVRAFRDALKIEWQPVKQAAEQSSDPALTRKQAAFAEIFALLAAVPETGLVAPVAERLQELAKEIEQPERIVGAMPLPTPAAEVASGEGATPLDNAPGTAVLPKTGAETPRGFTAGAVEKGVSPRGDAPEVVISAFDKERHESMRKMPALREKEDTAEARKWFARFGAAAVLALLATPTDNGRNTLAENSLPTGVSMLDSAWPTGVSPTAETLAAVTLPASAEDSYVPRESPELAAPTAADPAPVIEKAPPVLYTFNRAIGLNGKEIDTVSEAAFDEWQRNRSLLSKPITATQFLATMWNLLSELEKNPDLQKELTAEMHIDSENINKVFEGTENAIDLQPFYKLLESRI